MNNASIILAYCVENMKYASMIKGVLSDSIEVDTFQFDEVKNMNALADKAKGNFNPILILISDNFLKSDTYMLDAFETIQTLSNKGNLIPIIVDGEYHIDGQMDIVHTSFEKVSNVIQYMNYWQDRYLQLRKTKVNEDDPIEGNEFVNKLHSYRQISGEIGELLRFLRSIPTWTYDQFVESNYGGIVKAKHSDKPIDTNDDDEFDRNLLADLGDIPGLEMLRETDEGRIILPPFDHKAADELIHSGVDTPTTIENMISDIPEEDSNPHQKKYMDLDDFINDSPKEEDISEKKSILLEDLDDKKITPKQDIKAEKANEEEALLKSQLSKILNEGEDQISKFDYEKDDLSKKKEEIEPIKPTIVEKSIDTVESTIAEYKNKLAANPQQGEMRLAFAQFLAKNGRLSESTKELETILLYSPNDEDAYFQLALLAEQNRDYLMSKNFYEKVAILNPDFPNVYYHLGILTSEHFVGQKKQAAKYYKQAHKVDPKNIDALYQYAKLMLSYSGKYDKVIAKMHEVLLVQPNHPFAHFDLAKAYYESGQVIEAAHHYQNAFKINGLLKTVENDELFKLDAATMLKLEQSKVINQHQTEVQPLIDTNHDKIVLITGATSGIGKAITYLLASHGFKLILTGRREEKLIDIKSDLLSKYKNKIQLLPFDVRDKVSVNRLIQNLPEEWRNIDVLINNAGLALGFDEIHEGNITEWETMIDTNIKGLLYMTRAIAPNMVKRRKGHIINICSTAGKDVYPKGNVYAATKHAVDALTKAMRMDLYKYDIKVSQVAPGHVEETEFALVRFSGDAEKSKIYSDFNPLKSFDVAEAVYFIISRPAHVNVQDILIMGTQQGSVTNINKDGRRFDKK